MASDIQHQLYLHLKSDYPLVFLLTQEEKRAFEIIESAAKRLGRSVTCPRILGETPRVKDLLDSVADNHAVVVLDDVHHRLAQGEVVRWLRDTSRQEHWKHRTIVIIAPYLDLPQELESSSTVLELPLPSPDELGRVLDSACVSAGEMLADTDGTDIVRASQGMTEEEAYHAFKKALIGWPEDAEKALASVVQDKKLALRRSQVLENVDLTGALDDVGGLDQLKEWLFSRKSAFSAKARDYGLPAPRGLLLMGVQGCGKSLTAKAVAGYWRLPLVRLDFSLVFGATRPEAALRGALRVAEAMSPVVLWIDEIEKGFDRGGEGTSSRLLGGLVTWLQEKKKEVFVVATANRVADLPPELPRKGRFDEIFFVDLPNEHERLDILTIHLKKRGRNPEDFALESLAKKADRLTGSELEQLIVAALYLSFSRGEELSNDDLLTALKDTVSLYDTFEEEIKALREWARKRARPASTDRRRADMFAKT
jgi:SpoVK/Ycf46/Vps4 family AAA+-type ATPase